MLQIDNHKELALADIVPYLLQFPELYSSTEQSGDRYQVIEDTIWKLLYNLDYTTANGVWLDYIGKKVGQNRIYTPKTTDAFTFGGTSKEGFGAGKFKGILTVKNTKTARTDALFRNAIKAKIIQNNTDTSLDELIEACKLLFNAKVVNVEEQYPAGIKAINMYGSSLLQTLDAQETIKLWIPAGVSLKQVLFHIFYNLFKDDAFIEYTTLLPEIDNFELSFAIQPDLMPDKKIGLFSQGPAFSSQHQAIRMSYDTTNGFSFSLSPSYYNDNNLGNTYYNDEVLDIYQDASEELVLSGGADYFKKNEVVNIKITRTNNKFSLYVNNNLIDEKEFQSLYKIDQYNTKLFLGVSDGIYYNSGSIYSLLLKNLTKDTILINDNLKSSTIGINNGVRFI